LKKLLVVGVIVLFLGLACAPSINANVSKDSELVEITTEICGLGGGKHTVQLTKEEAEEVEQLIDDIEQRLDGIKTREETVEIFNEAVVELDKYGLLGGLSVKQAQRLVAGKYQNSFLVKLINTLRRRDSIPTVGYENKNCLIAGRTNATASCGLVLHATLNVAMTIAGFLIIWLSEPNDEFTPWLLLFYITLIVGANTISNLNPLAIGHTICFGEQATGFIYGGEWYYSAKGWVWTQGTDNTWKMVSPIWGAVTKRGLLFFTIPPLAGLFMYPGVLGFVGLKISYPYGAIWDAFFFGSCLSVKLDSERPYN